jgi:hypothetical protein
MVPYPFSLFGNLGTPCAPFLIRVALLPLRCSTSPVFILIILFLVTGVRPSVKCSSPRALHCFMVQPNSSTSLGDPIDIVLHDAMTIPTASVLLDRTAHSAGPNIGLAGMATLFACALLALLLCCSVVLLISRFCVLFLDFFLCLTFYHFLVSCFTFVAFRLCSFFLFSQFSLLCMFLFCSLILENKRGTLIQIMKSTSKTQPKMEQNQ